MAKGEFKAQDLGVEFFGLFQIARLKRDVA
jgi:hypothetical protein